MVQLLGTYLRCQPEPLDGPLPKVRQSGRQCQVFD